MNKNCNCEGCKEELRFAYFDCVRHGLRIDFEEKDGHIFLIGFTDEGEVMVD